MKNATPVATEATDPIQIDVKRQVRLELFEQALDRTLTAGVDGDFVIFERRGAPVDCVQFTLHRGELLGEVGRPPDSERVRALRCLGFEGGAGLAKFSRDGLPHDARRLACMTELLFCAAYRPPMDFDVTVITKAMVDEQAARLRLARPMPRSPRGGR